MTSEVACVCGPGAGEAQVQPTVRGQAGRQSKAPSQGKEKVRKKHLQVIYGCSAAPMAAGLLCLECVTLGQSSEQSLLSKPAWPCIQEVPQWNETSNDSTVLSAVPKRCP